MNCLVVESELQELTAFPSAAVERLLNELKNRAVKVYCSKGSADGLSVINSNIAVDCLLFVKFYNADLDNEQSVKNEFAIIDKLHERQPNVPVFLVSHRDIIVETTLYLQYLQKINEFIWILEDSLDFVAGRIMVAMKSYSETVLPPLVTDLKLNHDRFEYSYATPGHQGGIGFRKTPCGRAFFNFFGENIFNCDLSPSRTQLGSLLHHTKSFEDSEKNISKIFGSHMSFSGVVGTSGSNRTVMQYCIKDGDTVAVDRNCHKSIEQGLILTSANPKYMTPKYNENGNIGPISQNEIKNVMNYKPVYGVITNSTYDGICYNVKKILEHFKPPYLHFDEAWYGYAKFNPLYKNHYSMFGDSKDYKESQTLFATQSTHKMLNAFSQASCIHVRDGDHKVDFTKFNQAYMMHTTTSPFYPIIASNDTAAQMMKEKSGESLTQESINEAVDFRRILCRLHNQYAKNNEWFFKPWNKEKFGHTLFEDIDFVELCTKQDYWILKSNDEWHGFGEIDEDWVMLDPIKVTIITGTNDGVGFPAALVNAWLMHKCIVPAKLSHYQILFHFSMGITKGKWGTLLNTLILFKEHYDNNTPVREMLPEIYENYKYDMGIRELGEQMHAFLKGNRVNELLGKAYEEMPKAAVNPRKGYQQIQDSEFLTLKELSNRVVSTAILPYPPGIPMIISGERFGNEDSAQIKYLTILEEWGSKFPGFETEIIGVQIENNKYKILCSKLQ